jgi:uncharacterized membrane protein YfcA
VCKKRWQKYIIVTLNKKEQIYMETLLLIGVLAIIMEFIDSSMGMMYGTILSPLLIGMGFSPAVIIPSILISQAVGGIVGTVRHHNYNSANFNGLTKDTKIVLAIVLPGVLACVIGAYIAVSIPGWILKLYIGLLVIIMGFFCIKTYSFKFSWGKMYVIGMIAALNKALTIIFNGGIDYVYPLTMCIGAAIGAFIGPWVTFKIKTEKVRKLVGVLAIISGIWCIAKIFV